MRGESLLQSLTEQSFIEYDMSIYHDNTETLLQQPPCKPGFEDSCLPNLPQLDQLSGESTVSLESVVELDLDPESPASASREYTELSTMVPAFVESFSKLSTASPDSIACDNDDDCELHSNNSGTLFQNNEGDGDKLSWTKVHPDNWTSRQVLDWIYNIAGNESIDTSTLCGEAFNNVDGRKLSSWTRMDFLDADPMHGTIIHDNFCNLKTTHFEPPKEVVDTTGYSHPHFINPLFPDDDALLLKNSVDPYLPQSRTNQTVVKMNINKTVHDYSIDTDDSFDEIQLPLSVYPKNHAKGGQQQIFMNCSGGRVQELTPLPLTTENLKRSLSIRQGSSTTLNGSNSLTVAPPIKRRPGRPRKNSQMPSCTANVPQRRRTTNGRGGPKGSRNHSNRMLHLWEFIRDLLLDPNNCPHLICWENRREGVFRVVNSKEVARMWGVKKQNGGMTYEKFSRSMRFCRTQKYFGDVPKDGKYPKKLVFAFGERAFGWQLGCGTPKRHY